MTIRATLDGIDKEIAHQRSTIRQSETAIKRMLDLREQILKDAQRQVSRGKS